jgi:hypothetical protein
LTSQLSFTNTSRSNKQERTNWTIFLIQTDTITTNSFGYFDEETPVISEKDMEQIVEKRTGIPVGELKD